jgi:hypothetical protein
MARPPLDLGDGQARELTSRFDRIERELYAETTSAPQSAPAWWEVAYPGGPPVGPAKLIRKLHFPGSGASASHGPDVLAVKRGIWRGGRWEGPASRFDESYSRGFALGVGGNVIETGFAGFQRQMRFAATGVMDDESYQGLRYAKIPAGLPNAGQALLDATAIALLEQAAEGGYGGSIVVEDVRDAIADYCRRSIASEPKIHYRQERPIEAFGIPPEQGFTTDCSGHSTCAYFWAKKATGVAVPDPNGRNYDGYGYTGTLINNPEVLAPYQVGDLGLYGPSYSASSHVVTCYVAGNESSAGWCSHGSEGSPSHVKLLYRSDLLCVVRPRLTP